MKVLFATGIYPPDVGGPATYVSHLARELHARGHGVEVVTYGAREGAGADPFPVQGVPRHRRVAHRYASFFHAAARAARRADVLFAQDPLSVGLPTMLAGRRARRPVVVKVVGDLAWEIAVDLGRTQDSFQQFQELPQSVPVRLFRAAERRVAKSARRVIVPSAFLERVVLGWGVSPERVAVVHNSLPGEPLDASREEARRRLDVYGEPLLLAAGRLVPWKRFDLVLRALPDVVRAQPGARLVVAGSGPLESDLRRLAGELHLEGAVRFTGGLDHATMLLYERASDLLILPSTYEGFSHLLLEAMRLGTPVLASDAGGNPEVVGDAGRLVPVGSEDAFRAALWELAGDAELRAEMGERARRRAKDFTWDQLVRGTLDVLERAASD